jgi:uncharacterized membrane protein YccC
VRTARPGAAVIRPATFVARCTGAAILAYLAATALNLGHPVWAVVSALIVSQETLAETRRSLLWRIAGTVLGIAIAMPTAWMLMPDPTQPLLAIGVAVCIASACATRQPLLRVSMWTAPLVLLTAMPGHSIIQTALQRGGEVLIGGLIGAAVHAALDFALIRRMSAG